MKLRLTAPARADLEAIHAYIAAENPQAADRVTSTIIERAERIADSPYSGRQSDEPDIRVVVLPRFRYFIFYRVRSDEVSNSSLPPFVSASLA